MENTSNSSGSISSVWTSRKQGVS